MKYTYLIYYVSKGSVGNGDITQDVPIVSIEHVRALERRIAHDTGVDEIVITGFDLLSTEGQPEPDIDLYELRDAVRKALFGSGEHWFRGADRFCPDTSNDGWYDVYRDIREVAGWSPAPMEPTS